ncbi:LysR family transcriptional regulator ArgP [Phytoactinopolyspora mesophila]|uniref:HTH-type transcriptional regulator LysG n=1 Tax=Phytoactinopolyspora mesophila TaxID=2650750 RepID=A0A7K3M2Z3_9ACTN|nr:LysR family transcriptional regulator ArgP [Phytoactinopolyspora mesophila]NDL56808.1 ArgP/LysG family DNA-binding transcriptional regulator [Phytoactinopolyspora mesophila]
MRLDADQLAAFAAVVDEGSFEAAARRLHVTPSAVSQRIKALEASVGQVLVQRSRPSRPTEAGQILVRLAGQVSVLESEALSELMGELPGARAPLRMPVAVNADSLATWFLPALADLPAEQAMTFDIRQEDQDHSIALLRDGTVMAAVTAEAKVVQGCRAEALGAMRYLAVASPEFRRRHLESEKMPGALASAPMLVFNRKDGLQHRFLRGLLQRNADPPVTYLPSSWGFVEAARLGLGWGMVPEQMARPAIDAGELIEIRPGHPLDVPLYWQRWRLESAALAALTDVVKARGLGLLNQDANKEHAGQGR